MGDRTCGNTQQTYRKLVLNLLDRAWGGEKEGTAVVRLQYGYAETGRVLYEAGQIRASREYVESGKPDPFRWPGDLRDEALRGMGYEFDDQAAYPRARVAMIVKGRTESARFLVNREEILEKCGAKLFPDEPDAKMRRANMKVVTNGYDMDSGVDAWAKKLGNPKNRSARNVKVTLNDGSSFTLMAYREAQIGCTPDMAKGSARMLAMLKTRAAGSKKKEEKVERTLKSYLLQEAEATSRGAKIAWLKANGVKVMNLQHDGIFVDSLPGGMELEEVAEKLSEAATAACKYQVVVKGKKGGEWEAGQDTRETGNRKGLEELRADLMKDMGEEEAMMRAMEQIEPLVGIMSEQDLQLMMDEATDWGRDVPGGGRRAERGAREDTIGMPPLAAVGEWDQGSEDGGEWCDEDEGWEWDGEGNVELGEVREAGGDMGGAGAGVGREPVPVALCGMTLHGENMFIEHLYSRRGRRGYATGVMAGLLDRNEGVRRVHMIVRRAKQQAAMRELCRERWGAETWVEPRCEQEDAVFERIYEHYPHRQEYLRVERENILKERRRKRREVGATTGEVVRVWSGSGHEKSAWDQVKEVSGVAELIKNAEEEQLRRKGGSGEGLGDLLEDCGSVMVLYAESRGTEGGEGEDGKEKRQEGGEGPEAARKGERVKALVQEERWEEKRVTWEGGMRTGGWEIWYRREGERESEKWLEVRESREEGRHLVAGRDFAYKEAVVAYLGDEITKEELKIREEEGRADHVMQVGAKLVDGRLHKCGGQYMNTSVWEGEENNVEMMGAPYGTLRIAREGGVRKGEQLLLDYGGDYWASEERKSLLEKIWAGGEEEASSGKESVDSNPD